MNRLYPALIAVCLLLVASVSFVASGQDSEPATAEDHALAALNSSARIDHLVNPIVQHQLDFTTEQKNEFQKLIEDYRDRIRTLSEAGKLLSGNEKRSFLGQAHREAVQAANVTLNGIIIDVQRKELDQMILRERFKQGGLEFLINSQDLLSDPILVGINADDMARLILDEAEAKAALEAEKKKLRDEYLNKMKQAEDRYRERVGEILSTDQKKAIAKALGIPFDGSDPKN